MPILPLVPANQIHPDVKHLTLGAMGPAANMEQMEHRLMSPQVVATTALTIDQYARPMPLLEIHLLIFHESISSPSLLVIARSSPAVGSTTASSMRLPKSPFRLV
jgi:hypothetical protein